MRNVRSIWWRVRFSIEEAAARFACQPYELCPGPLEASESRGSKSKGYKTLEGALERKADVHGLLPLRFVLRNLGLSSARDQSQVRRNLRAPPKARSVEGARKDKASVHC